MRLAGEMSTDLETGQLSPIFPPRRRKERSRNIYIYIIYNPCVNSNQTLDRNGFSNITASFPTGERPDNTFVILQDDRSSRDVL